MMAAHTVALIPVNYYSNTSAAIVSCFHSRYEAFALTARRPARHEPPEPRTCNFNHNNTTTDTEVVLKAHNIQQNEGKEKKTRSY